MRLLLLRPSLFSIPNLLQFLHPFSSSYSSSARKKTMGERTPDGLLPPHRRGGGSIPAGKSSLEPKVELSESSRRGPRSKAPHSVVQQQWRPSRGRAGSDSSTVARESTPEPMLPFDICRIVSRGPVKLNPSLRELNRERRKELERSRSVCKDQILRPGMVLRKQYLCHQDQVTIVQKCRELGVGVGGFYRPGYSDGAKLNLVMMCLGQNWDPQSRKYEPMRPIDGAKPPGIPFEFMKLVEGAVQTSRDFLMLDNMSINIDNELPKISPDICIVNFYNTSGRLGLHQDRDESQESLRRGLPVVSFSIGDSAVFSYGDDRDVDKAEKVVLESGDVLIFGGKSRHIFHGVSAIRPDTAPKSLIEETNLRQGRLNLTFRQY